MSSLQRTRSMRQPTTSSVDTTRTRRTRADTETRQDVSPSRLPIKPLTRSATMGPSSSGSNTTASRGSPIGPGTLRRSNTLRQTASSQEPARRETSRYPPSTTTTRARGPARPSSAEGMPSPPRKAPLHTRAKSTATGLNGGTVLRPPTSASTSSTSTTATARSRKQSISERTAAAAAAAPAQAQAQPRLRPAFSTLQQHYSPAKSAAPKPLTSTFLAPPSPSKLPANVAASAETHKLQTELLQLHLLHRDAVVVDAEWRASARQKLGDRFTKLAETGRAVDEQEKAEVERENVLALRQWAAGGGLEERIQALDAVINGLWALGEPGGRYARVVRRFERWVDRMCEVEEARRDGGRFLQDQDVIFIGEIDLDWKDEFDGLIRRLDGWQRLLQDTGDVPEVEGETEGKSSLQRMIEYSRTMIHDMLAELSLMEEIEREALAREDEWIERMNRDDEADDTPRAGAVWRAI